MKNEPFVYFGTPYVARDTLAILLERGFKPSLVVTSPDAARGRGLAIVPCETKVFAQEHGIPVFSPPALTGEAIAHIQTYGTAYAIVVAYGKIFPEALIASFPKGVLNIHYSLLPKYRGASPVEYALLSGDPVTGVTIQKMQREIDAGDILAQKEVVIDPTETTRELRPRLISIGAKLLADMLPTYLEGSLVPVAQDFTQATRAPKIAKEEGLLELEGSPEVNWRKYRAYAESPGTYFLVEQDGALIRVKIKTAAYDGTSFKPVRIVPEGKKEMDFDDFKKNLLSKS